MSSYTKGPWKATKYPEQAFYPLDMWDIVVKDHDKDNPFAIAGLVYQEANARLMAAAPEMADIIPELLIYAREVYDHTLKCDTEDEATLIGEAIEEAEDILRRIDGEEESK